MIKVIREWPSNEADRNLESQLLQFEKKVKEVKCLFQAMKYEQHIQAVALFENALKEFKAIIQAETEISKTSAASGASNKSELSCSACNLTFQKLHYYNRHVNGHSKNTCEICSTSFARRRALVTHMAEEHKVKKAETVYGCEYCNRQFAKKPSLVAHMVNHAKEMGKVGCQKCGKFCSSHEELELHDEEHEQSSKFCCLKCGQNFKRKQQFDAHLEAHEKNRCKECGENFSDFKLLARHASKIHNQVLQRPNQGVKEAAAKTRKKVDDDETLREFPIGRPKSSSITSAEIHDDDVPETPWNPNPIEEEATVCQFCGAMFSYRQALEKHSVNCGSSLPDATEEHRFKCSHCRQTFKSKAALARHNQVHDVERPFLCHCGHAYKRYKHLQKHLLLEHNTVVREENQLLVAVCTDFVETDLSERGAVDAVLHPSAI